MTSNNFGLNNDYEYMELVLDSLDATSSYQSSAAATDWPLFVISGKGPIDYMVALKIMEVQIPVSWYVFNTVNNTFLLTESGPTIATYALVTLPVGNYNTTEVSANFGTALTAASVAIGNNRTYTVTYNDNLGKFVISAGASATFPFTLTFGAPAGIPGVQPNSGNTNPRLWLGFPPGSTTSTYVGGHDVLQAPNYQMIGGPAYVYLNSTVIGSNVDLYLPEGAFNLSGGKAGPQIAKIPVNANSGGWIAWSDPDPQKYFPFNTTNSLNLVDFYLTLGNTTSQRPLQLNGLSFSIKVAILYKKNHNQGDGQVAYNGRVYSRQGFNSSK